MYILLYFEILLHTLHAPIHNKNGDTSIFTDKDFVNTHTFIDHLSFHSLFGLSCEYFPMPSEVGKHWKTSSETFSTCCVTLFTSNFTLL